MMDEYLQHKGYFTQHNIKFRPACDHVEYDTRQDAVHSDIDVIGIHPRLDGARRVMVVSCKSWQGGFRPEYWIDAIVKNKVVSGRGAWRGFRELTPNSPCQRRHQPRPSDRLPVRFPNPELNQRPLRAPGTHDPSRRTQATAWSPKRRTRPSAWTLCAGRHPPGACPLWRTRHP